MSAAGHTRLAALLLATTAGCTDQLPPLQLEGVVPSSMVEGTAQHLVVTGQLRPWVRTSFDEPKGSELDAEFRVHLGELRLGGARLTEAGLEADLPANLAPGVFDLTVSDPWGRSATLAEAFKVLPRLEGFARPSALQFDPVGPQRAGAPFEVILRALDAASSPLTSFSGVAALDDTTGTLAPRRVAVLDGVWRGYLEVRQAVAVGRLHAAIDAIEGSSNDFAVGPGEAALRFLTPGLEVLAGQCSQAATVALLGMDGLPAQPELSADVSVALEPGLAEVFADPLCTVPLTHPALDPSGRLVIYVRGTVALQLALAVSSASYGSDAQPLRILAGPPALTRFVTPPRTAAAGTCSAPLEVQVEDAWGNPVVDSQGLGIAVEVEPGVGLFSETACQKPTDTADLASLVQRSRLHFSGTRAGTYTVRAAAPGTTAATQLATVTPASPSALAFTSPPMTLPAGECSGPLEFEVRDAFGNPAPLQSPGAAALAALPGAGLDFFVGAGCQAPIASVPLGAGQTRGAFRLRAVQSGPVALTALLEPLLPAEQTEEIRAGAPEHLAFLSAPRSLTAGECSAAVVIAARDRYGNPASLDSPLPIDLAAEPATGFTFFEDSGCAAPSATATLPVGDAKVALWFIATQAGEPVVIARAASGLEARQAQWIGPSTPEELAYVSPAQTVMAGVCSAPVALQVRDRFGNPSPVATPSVITLSAAPSAGFALLADASCTTPAVDHLDLAPGESEARVFFSGTPAGTVVVTAKLAALPAAQQAETVAPGAPEQLAFTSPPQRLLAGTCSDPARVELRDRFGNPTSPGLAVDGSIAAAPAEGFGFFSDASCSAPAPGFTLAADRSDFSFKLVGTRSGSATLRASAPGVASAEQPIVVDPGPTTRLVFAPIPSPQRADYPFPVALEARDDWDNPTPAFTGSAALSLLPAGGDVRCVASCLDPSTTTAFASGSWSGSVGAGALGTWQLEAQAGAASGTSATFEVIGNVLGPIARLDAVPAVVHNSRTVVFDASRSTDTGYPSAALVYSWDLIGTASGPPPWTPWSATSSRSQFFGSETTVEARVAVRNPAGVVGYAQRRVRVVPSSALCTVSSNTDVDDGGGCLGGVGPDGQLSLREAIRFADKHPGTQAITFSGPMTLDSGAAYQVSVPLQLSAPPGVLLRGARFDLTAGAAVVLSGLELSGASAGIEVGADARLELLDSVLHDGPAIHVVGQATLRRVQLQRCAGACVLVEGDSARLEVAFSRILDSDIGLRLEACQSSPVLIAQSSVLAGLAQAVAAGPACTGAAQIRHATFDQNGTGLSLSGGTGHELRNCIFTRHAVRAADLGSATFAARDGQLLFSNADDAALAGDPGALTVDPLFVDADGRDYRLQAESPARDSAPDLSLDLNGPAPGNFDGNAPDRGAEEDW
ncbi:MAG TPA: hypothetical protein VGK67_02095 [Myxococcales bacterium]